MSINLSKDPIRTRFRASMVVALGYTPDRQYRSRRAASGFYQARIRTRALVNVVLILTDVPQPVPLLNIDAVQSWRGPYIMGSPFIRKGEAVSIPSWSWLVLPIGAIEGSFKVLHHSSKPEERK